MKRTLICLATLILGVAACSEKEDKHTGGGGGNPANYVMKQMESPEFVFGFEGENRYSYCPSVICDEKGDGHLFFCGTLADQFVDNIYYAPLKAWSPAAAPKSVLTPSLSWDSRHVCDPCILEGRFRMDGKDYRYALFFLSNPLEYYYNEIGVAFSDSPAGPWTKYPQPLVSKPWAHDGDEYYSETGRCWGVGQVSAISLDKGGRILLTYTKGALDGTRVVWRDADLSDMSVPRLEAENDMVTTGLIGLDGKADWTCNSDFALSEDSRYLLMVRPVQPHPSSYPAYIPAAQEVDWIPWTDFRQGSGRWTSLLRIDKALTGSPRNHNACLGRDPFGRVKQWSTPMVFYTVSAESPSVAPSDGMHAEWTYHIWRYGWEWVPAEDSVY